MKETLRAAYVQRQPPSTYRSWQLPPFSKMTSPAAATFGADLGFGLLYAMRGFCIGRGGLFACRPRICLLGAATPCVVSPAPSKAPTIKANLNFCFIRYLLLTPGNFSPV
jgi:hypothetical protein